MAYVNPKNTWNGFQCPSFTYEEGMRICKALRGKYDVKLIYNKKTDSFDEYPSPNEGYTAKEIKEMGWPIKYGAEIEDTVDGPMRLYPIGSAVWVWDKYTTPRKPKTNQRTARRL